MEVIEILKNEHQNILKRLEIFRELSSSNIVEKVAELEGHIDFFVNYADHFHHAKEEEILFKWMISKNPMFESGPIAVMLSDHDFGRERLNEIVSLIPSMEKGDAEAVNKIVGNIEAFYTMLVNHIGKEDNILYQFAQNLNANSGDGDADMLDAFNEVNKSMGADMEKYFS